MIFRLWDYVEIYLTIDRTRPPQIILIEWRRITFGLKPFSIVRTVRAAPSYFIRIRCVVIADIARGFGFRANGNAGERG